QVATAALAPTDITVPIRWLLRGQQNATVLMAEVQDIDPARRIVIADGGQREMPYDFLILATGARHSYFGHPEWEAAAPGLKSIEDAIRLRQRILGAFEEAEKANDDATRGEWLTFVIVGAGPTGAEMAGMISTIARGVKGAGYRRLEPTAARVILVEGGARVLSSFPEPLAAQARRDLEELGVEVRTGSTVTKVERRAVHIGEERLAARTIVWAAGNAASPLGASTGALLDRAGRVLVEPELSVPSHPELFVVGDLASVRCDGREVPGVAPAATQMGACAARNVLHAIAGTPPTAFRYRNKGDLATIGRYRAIAHFGWGSFTGRLAWWLWLFVHILYLAGFRNRVTVLVQWGYSFFTYQHGARLITARTMGGLQDRGQPSPPR
ncbi:MAG: NAD(P)/FAD-dependent oxidoreductase, partial [Gemmatimonadaceae bacterium]|nr:NAD(P)/FAD-dependent oxidoreductase [Gemmatimonadaceae bacterium]